mmetsp:Transcript_46333/g.56148  ORF Transcript_46333/g.56148 Transcript_46333/m.56148 type:complete len:206 (-) Transcript_46333:910-1527(-)
MQVIIPWWNQESRALVKRAWMGMIPRVRMRVLVRSRKVVVGTVSISSATFVRWVFRSKASWIMVSSPFVIFVNRSRSNLNVMMRHVRPVRDITCSATETIKIIIPPSSFLVPLISPTRMIIGMRHIATPMIIRRQRSTPLTIKPVTITIIAITVAMIVAIIVPVTVIAIAEITARIKSTARVRTIVGFSSIAIRIKGWSPVVWIW